MLRLLLYAAIVVTMCRCAPSQQPSSHLPSEETLGLSLISSIAIRTPKTHRAHHLHRHQHQEESNAARNERSANLSHITGTSRKIQMHVKNKLLQILPDGVVNGTSEDTDYTILQRTTISVGQIRIQAVATCLFLCMDSCGLLYGSKIFTEDCVFSEKIDEGNYNTYSSTLYSGRLRTLYLALNKFGQPRKVQIPAARPLGKLSTYARTLPIAVTPERLDRLARNLGIIPSLRMCPLVPLRPSVAPEMDEFGRDRGRCRRRKKRKKRKRKDEEITTQAKPKKKFQKGKKDEGLIGNKKHGPKHKHHHGKLRKKTEVMETTVKPRTTPDEEEETETSTEDEWEVTASLTDYEDSVK